MSDVTEFSQVAFDKRFKFLADMEQNEKKILSKKLRKVKDKELKGNIHKLINRLVLKFIPNWTLSLDLYGIW